MGATMIDSQLCVQAGINPAMVHRHTPAPTTTNTNPLKESMRRNFENLDAQDFTNRFTWYNLPDGMTGPMLEQILYNKGQIAGFYIAELDKFFFLPYTLSSQEGTGLDAYGRFTHITPIPLAGVADSEGNMKPFIPGKHFEVIYDVILPEDLDTIDLTNKAVLLHDYTPSVLTQTCVPRQSTQNGILDVMSDIIPLMRTALVNGTGVTGLKTEGGTDNTAVAEANRQFQNASINGQRYVSVASNLEMEALGDSRGSVDAEKYLQVLQSIDNLRLGMYGIPNGGVFAKNSHMLQTEQDMAGGSTGLALQDALYQRQRFADLFNSLFWPLLGGQLVWCEVSESVNKTDKNADGEIANDQDQTGTQKGSQPEVQE